MKSELALSARLLSVFFDAFSISLADALRSGFAQVDSTGSLGHDPEEAIRALKSLGLFRHLLPEAVGGAGHGKPNDPKFVSVRALVTIREALGAISPVADSIFAVQGLGSYPIAVAGTDEQKRKYLPGVLEGSRIGAFALTEPEAGSDVASLQTTATKTEHGWSLRGEKTLISNVGIASHYVVFARARGFEGASLMGPKTITAFLVDRGTPGVTETKLETSSPHPLGALRFDDCEISDGACVGAIGRGMALALETLDTFRISVGAAANGMASRALSESISRVKSRKQFGAALATQQMVRAYIAEMATELEASRLLVARAAHAHDLGGGRVTTQAAMAKMFATEAAQRIIDKAVQLHGGSGVLVGSVVEALYRDIRPLRIYEGTTEIQKLVIARALLDD